MEALWVDQGKLNTLNKEILTLLWVLHQLKMPKIALNKYQESNNNQHKNWKIPRLMQLLLVSIQTAGNG